MIACPEMIVANRRSWVDQVLSWQGTALRVVWRRVAVATGLAVVATILQDQYQLFETNLTPLPFTLIGLALSIYLGFRNNTGYDRFWEGRKLWGRLVNVSRSFARQVQTLAGKDPEEHRALVRMQIGYVHAVRLHLRDEDTLEELAPFVDEATMARLPQSRNRPIVILHAMAQRLRAIYDRGDLHPMHLRLLEESLTECTGIQGACERIKSTPIPFSYTVLMHRIVAVYCLGLPFGIVDVIHGFTPVVVMIVAYAFYGLDAVGTEIENPFDCDANDLPLSALSRTIEINLREAIGETELPEFLAPVDGVLH